MTSDQVDIIIPVWNRPLETQACLVSLVEHTPNARLVLVDNGSDRETERILEAFSEALDVRMLLLRNRVNEGFVKALNRGLLRSESRFVAVMRTSSRVTGQWLEPLHAFAEEAADTGIVVPAFSEKGKKPAGYHSGIVRGTELACGEFAAMLLSRPLLDMIGGFSEDMDGALWCLKDYSQRAGRKGFRTCAVPESVVERGEEICFGSLTRRAEHEKRVKSAYEVAWGEERVFCLHLPKGCDLSELEKSFATILTCARHGHRVVLLAHASLVRTLVDAGYGSIHSNISIQPISRLMADRSARNAISGLAGLQLPLTLLDWQTDVPFPGGVDSHPFGELEEFVRNAELRHYDREVTGNAPVLST